MPANTPSPFESLTPTTLAAIVADIVATHGPIHHACGTHHESPVAAAFAREARNALYANVGEHEGRRMIQAELTMR